MKLWKLERTDTVQSGDNQAAIVRAPSAGMARELLSKEAEYPRERAAWLDHEKSACEEVLVGGPPGVVLKDWSGD